MREQVLTQRECLVALREGYILKNEHGFTAQLEKGVQKINNKTRKKRRKNNYPYSFDYPTWRKAGRISRLKRAQNTIYRGVHLFLARVAGVVHV